MTTIDIDKYWCDVGKSLELENPEKAARAFLNGGNYIRGYEILLGLYQQKAEAIANDGMNAKDLETAVDAIEIIQNKIDILKSKQEN